MLVKPEAGVTPGSLIQMLYAQSEGSEDDIVYF